MVEAVKELVLTIGKGENPVEAGLTKTGPGHIEKSPGLIPAES